MPIACIPIYRDGGITFERRRQCRNRSFAKRVPLDGQADRNQRQHNLLPVLGTEFVEQPFVVIRRFLRD
jgi:hypothetical protein